MIQLGHDDLRVDDVFCGQSIDESGTYMVNSQGNGTKSRLQLVSECGEVDVPFGAPLAENDLLVKIHLIILPEDFGILGTEV
jgi:hypothetical protein